MKENQYSFATWLRVFGVILILLCHLTQQNDNPYVVMSAQLFNIGNSIFFILSGFLFGIKGSIRGPVLSWYKKRLKRIYIPYEIMVITLFIIHIFLKITLKWELWIPQFIGVHGWNVVWGATQTWFVTAILFCYLCTPLMFYLISWAQTSKFKGALLYIILLSAPVILAYILPSEISSILAPVSWYTMAMIIGLHFDTIYPSLKLKVCIVLFSTMMVGFIIRLACKIHYDGTIFYDQIIASYTHVLGAFCIFFIFAYYFSGKRAPAPIHYISGISFDIYLWHYMFVDGPLCLFGKTGSWILDCILITVITIGIAAVVNLFQQIYSKKVTVK